MKFKVGDIIRHVGHGRLRIVTEVSGGKYVTKQVRLNEVMGNDQTFSSAYIHHRYRKLTKLEKALK